MSPQATLYKVLEREFCPPIESSLLTVLLADINSNGDGELPSSDQIQGLRSLLRELVSQAELNEHQELGGIRLSDETDSTPDLYAGDTTGSKFSSSSGPPHSFSSPLGFLQAALPHIPKAKLNRAISAVGDADIDMESIVEGLLTQEYFGELEERGVDGLDSDNDSENVGDDFWETVELRGKPWNSSTSSRAGRRKMNKGKTLIIVDIRQKHHAPLRNHSSQSQDEIPAPDPWTQLSSLSEYVATLLPPHPAVFFQSFFHSPDHSTPYYALRAAISSTCAVAQPDSHGYTSVLFGLLDILLPSPEAFDAEQRSLIISDTQLSLNATEGRGDDALDLVKLLWDLYSDAAAGYLQMGVYHTPSPATDATGGGSRSLISLPTISKPKHKPPSTPPSNSRKPSPFQWQAVPQRKTSTRHSLHPSTAFIPQIVAGGHRDGDTGGLSLSEAQSCRKRIGECMRKRNELLREATKAWQGGSSKTRGGEVAYYFAERAREVQEAARRESLDVARRRVESKRVACPDIVDLHGATASEAITIVKEILDQFGPSHHKPLKVITGRGTHSANKVSVLKPAVTSALVRDSWIVYPRDGGLTVRGKRNQTS